MSYKGDFTPGKTVRLRFNTHQSDGTPITLAGTPAISVYKGSTTESTAGVSLTVDYDSRTGLHDVVIDTSADGTFYAAGNDFTVVITTGTVNSVSVVGTVVGSFSLSNRSALRPTTADRTLAVDASNKAPATIAAGDIATDAIDAAALKTDAVTEIVAAVFASTAPDGVAASTVLSRLNAFAKGHRTSTNNGNGTYTIAFKAEDNTTTLFSITFNPSTGVVS